MSDPQRGHEAPYQVDDATDRTIFGRRSGEVAAFLLPHLRPGMRLIDCGCGPGSITVDLAQAVMPGDTIGIDVRNEALRHARKLARDRRVSNVRFVRANIYQLPYPDASFDAAFACAVIQHLASPVAGLNEMRRVLKPGGVIGVVDGSSPITLRFPTNPILDAFDMLRVLEREHRTGYTSRALELRALLRQAGFERTRAFAEMGMEAGPAAGTIEETRTVAQNHLTQLRGQRGKVAVEQGWATPQQLEQMAIALVNWGDDPDAFIARPVFKAIGWTSKN